MADHPVQLETLDYRRLFPWLHLLRAFWIAVDIRKLLLASVALVLVAAGALVVDRLPFGRPPAGSEYPARWPWQQTLGYEPLPISPAAELHGALEQPRASLVRVLANWHVVLTPLRALIEPASAIFRPDASWSELADAVTRLLWMLAVWALFGGAIARMAAVQFARDQNVGIRRALVFAGTRFAGYFSAPLLPFVGVAILWALCVIGGWIGRIPQAGEPILGALWGLELLFGFLMAIVLIGVAVGWPLMFATISVEGTDGFDGLSRAYNYVYERPLYLLWQAVLIMIYGSLAVFFVWLVCQAAASLAVWGVSWGQGYEATREFIGGASAVLSSDVGGPGAPSVGARVAAVWMSVLGLIVHAFVYSFFWTCATILYFTLRRSVDANDFDEVFVEEEQNGDDLLPLVGSAAMGDLAIASAAGPAATSDAGQKPGEPPPVDLAP